LVQASSPPADAPMPTTAKPFWIWSGLRAPLGGALSASPGAIILGGFLSGMV